MDLLVSLISFISVKISDKPLTLDHPYGHDNFKIFHMLKKIIIIEDEINKINDLYCLKIKYSSIS